KESKKGQKSVSPHDRNSTNPYVIISTASAALPVNEHTQPCCILPCALRNTASFSAPTDTCSSDCARAASYFPFRILVRPVSDSANNKVAAWPTSRATLSARSASASAASGLPYIHNAIERYAKAETRMSWPKWVVNVRCSGGS